MKKRRWYEHRRFPTVSQKPYPNERRHTLKTFNLLLTNDVRLDILSILYGCFLIL